LCLPPIPTLCQSLKLIWRLTSLAFSLSSTPQVLPTKTAQSTRSTSLTTSLNLGSQVDRTLKDLTYGSRTRTSVPTIHTLICTSTLTSTWYRILLPGSASAFMISTPKTESLMLFGITPALITQYLRGKKQLPLKCSPKASRTTTHTATWKKS